MDLQGEMCLSDLTNKTKIALSSAFIVYWRGIEEENEWTIWGPCKNKKEGLTYLENCA